jgi:hypothetical protein
VEFLDSHSHREHYVRRPFQREPDFGVTSANYDLQELIARAETPRWLRPTNFRLCWQARVVRVGHQVQALLRELKGDDRITLRGATRGERWISAGAKRNSFRNCLIEIDF